MSKRILVTGGAGFLGSHLCDRLIERGDEVICLDNFFTGTRSNIAHLIDHKQFSVIEHDIIEPAYIDVDQIYNLACPAAPGHYQYDPIYTTKTSFLGTWHMLGLATRCKARFLQASTSEVYGDPDVDPQPETYRGAVNPIGPRACYDEGKRAAESLIFDYHRQHKVCIKVARIFNTYGPRMHPFDGRFVSNFIRQAIHGEDLTLYGDGQQTRAFCYVSDLVSGLMALMDSTDEVTGPINLGNPGVFTIRQLAEMVAAQTDNKSEIVQTRPLPVDDPKDRRPDITLAGKMLQWEPSIPLEDGLARTIEWFKSININDYEPPTPNY